jgi:hypothetical protein
MQCRVNGKWIRYGFDSTRMVTSSGCGAENISFGSGSMELQIQISAPASVQAPDSFIRYLENYHFDLRNRIKCDNLKKAWFFL